MLSVHANANANQHLTSTQSLSSGHHRSDMQRILRRLPRTGLSVLLSKPCSSSQSSRLHLRLYRQPGRCLSLSQQSSSQSAEAVESAIKHCIAGVSAEEPEQASVIRALPNKYRASMFALRAFNLELSQVYLNNKEKDIGMMRYTWWRDTLTDVFLEVPPPLPVAQVLSPIIAHHNLSPIWFKRILEAWERVLRQQPEDINQLTQFVENTHSSQMYLSLQTLSVKNVHADHVAR